ncbi:MAG: hypothetical protein JSV86_12190 [Gemmatimonadota bacterium]|nr:MAG: hypothetical protein JSV86_12190 [Gemmatimonadota bacterium]
MRTKPAGWVAVATAACVALFAAACGGDDGTGPARPGQLTVSVSTTGDPGAAFLVLVRGDSISNPATVNSGDLIYSYTSGITTRVAVIGSHSLGPLFEFTVPDVGQASSYTVSLLQVAGSDNALMVEKDFTLTISN